MSQKPYDSPDADSVDSTSSGDAAAPKSSKLPLGAHVLCGWPLLLAAVGGALGGGLGGAAYVINIAIYKSTLPVPVKAVLNIVTGIAAIAIWFAIALAIHSARS